MTMNNQIPSPEHSPQPPVQPAQPVPPGQGLPPQPAPAYTAHTVTPPPGGTYPPPGYQAPQPWHGAYTPPPPPVDDRPVKVRRVGRISAAFALISIGIVMVLQMFISFPWDTVLRFTPVFLVVFGVEILLSIFREKNVRLKYDVAGIFISLVLIAGSVAIATIPQYIKAQQTHYETSQRLATELEQQSYTLLKDSGLAIDSLTWYVSSNGGLLPADMTVADIEASNYVQFRVYFSKVHNSREAFAADCRSVINAIGGLVPNLTYASFYDYDYYNDVGETPHYALYLDNIFQMELSAEDLASRVDVTYYTDYGYFHSEDEYRQYQDEQAAEQAEAVDTFNGLYYKDGYYFFPDGRVIPEHEDMPEYGSSDEE